MAALDGGVALTKVVGHSGPSSWTADVVLAVKDVPALAREKPGLVDVQLGWTLLGDPALVVM